MSQPSHATTDLVFTVSGGLRDGGLVSVKTRKCMLILDDASTNNNVRGVNENPRVAVFRGPAGVTVRNYGDEILINGESTTTHWLLSGDQIQFPNSMTLEVVRIGQIAADTSPAVDQSDLTKEGEIPMSNDIQNNSSPAEAQAKLDRLENQISEIQQQNQHVHGRFNELDQRLSQLTDQLSTLVSLSSSGSSVSKSPAKEITSESSPAAKHQSAESACDAPRADKTAETKPFRSSGSNATSPSRQPRHKDDALASEWAKIESNQPTSFAGAFEPATATESETDASESHLDLVSQFRQQFSDEIQEDASAIGENESESTRKSLGQTTELSGDEDSVHNERHSESGEQTDSESSVEIQDEVEPINEFKSASHSSNENVTELLARMKAEGKWGAEDEQGTEDHGASGNSASGPVSLPQQHAQPTSSKSAGSPDLDVEDYMSQLLSRMRGGADPAPKQVKSETKKEAPIQPVKREAPKNVEPLKPEDFVPKQKATKIDALDAMRALANSTARTAVADSEGDRRRALGFVQLAIAFGSLAMSGYYFYFLCKTMGDTHSIIGFTCLALSGFLGLRYLMSFAPTRTAGPKKTTEVLN